MKIHLYECADAPPARRWLAVCFDHGEPLPVNHWGAQPEALRERVVAWWDAELARAAKRAGPRPAKKPKPPAEDVGDVI